MHLVGPPPDPWGPGETAFGIPCISGEIGVACSLNVLQVPSKIARAESPN